MIFSEIPKRSEGSLPQVRPKMGRDNESEASDFKVAPLCSVNIRVLRGALVP
jgi:hypothetical protein